MNNPKLCGTIFTEVSEKDVLKFHNKHRYHYNFGRKGTEDYLIAKTGDNYSIIITIAGSMDHLEAIRWLNQNKVQHGAVTCGVVLDSEFFKGITVVVDCEQCLL